MDKKKTTINIVFKFYLRWLKNMSIKKIIFYSFALLIFFSKDLLSISSVADASAQENYFLISNLWILLASFLVFIMHLGFACLEAGLTQAKNTINILFKNICIIAIGILTYALIGFSLMYPGGWMVDGWLGWSGLGLSMPGGNAGLIEYSDGNYTYWTDFIFQGMFAATAATIVSGSVAERIKLKSFLIFSIIYVGIVYPFLGSWKWGGGWLDALGFYDFAGSTLVHSVGGWAALAGVLLLGPRLRKYLDKKTINAIPGSNIPLATIGCFLLWFGWFGFNGGSVLSADSATLSYVCLTTVLAACAGILGSYVVSSIVQKKPDITMLINGALGGLVSITAGADVIGIFSSVIVGAVGGAIVVLAVIFIDSKLKIDDPVGAISVHLVCGVWGTLAVGIFSTNSDHSFISQLIGVVAYGLVSFLAALIIFTIVKAIWGLRVSAEEETLGLDISEHGMESYPSFQIFNIK